MLIFVRLLTRAGLQITYPASATVTLANGSRMLAGSLAEGQESWVQVWDSQAKRQVSHWTTRGTPWEPG